MAVVQIPNLPVAISIDGNELLECVQGGVSRRININQIWNQFNFFSSSIPITVDNDYTVGPDDSIIICNGAGIITITLPSIVSSVGRILVFKTITNNGVVSSLTNVAPIQSDVLSTYILNNVAGAWAMIQNDGANWVTIASNNQEVNALIWES